MSFDFMDRRSAERFAELLDEPSGGRRHHARGQADEDLAELVATAERDGIGRTAELEREPAAETAGARRPLFGRRIRARGAIVIGVAEALVSSFVNPAWAPGIGFAILLATLAAKPSGLFGWAR